MKKKNDYFKFENKVTPHETAKEKVVVTDQDFQLVNTSDYSHDQKFETKPTTFLKDSVKRFSKNKSSVVATYILGILLLGSVLIPIIDRSDVSVPSPYQTYLEPKLFDAGTGFWDGTREYVDIAYYEDPVDPSKSGPDPIDFNLYAVSNLKITGEKYVNSYSKFAKGGFVKVGRKADDIKDDCYLENIGFELDTTVANSVEIVFGDEEIEFNQLVRYRIDFLYDDINGTEFAIQLADYSTDYSIHNYDLTAILLAENPSETIYKNSKISITVDCTDKTADSSILIKSIVFATNSVVAEYVTAVTAPNFTDANDMIGRSYTIGSQVQNNYWNCNGDKYLYKAIMTSCSFTYDTYAGAYGIKEMTIGELQMKEYRRNGWCEYNFHDGPSSFVILDAKKCPITEVLSQSQSGGSVVTYTLKCKAYYYRIEGMDAAPRYIFGTDKSGRDMLKYVFEGLRTSLLLGIVTSAICFIFGLCWGAISGYFGGNVDLAMERFTDILGGLPWIVIMTLAIIHLGQSFAVFALALCLTGWIGTSATTRTQFYRFKGREYVLASRTLGASDIRLIFKHILPNAMGTIITGAVLMIPGVIFSEATISYLGLGLRGMSSLGVILSSNQNELLSHPYLLIFPSVIIALLEISFNLFGNGLRDAINPTLKGEDE